MKKNLKTIFTLGAVTFAGTVGAFADAAMVDLSSVTTTGAGQITAGGTSAVPLWAALIGLTMLVAGFGKVLGRKR